MALARIRTSRLFEKSRPESYIDEVLDCATAYNDDYILFNREADCWKTLEKKYENYVPTKDDLKRMAANGRNQPRIGKKNIEIIIEQNLCLKAKHNIELKGSDIKTNISYKDKVKASLPVLKAMISGTEISEERQIKRLEVCSECEWVSLINNKPACGICGCKLKTTDKSLVNLVSLEETGDYGCKHPKGSRWKAAGV
jgi:hypothetical protein